jgi:glycosyltransferase involved in cell wall biosynthesis
MGSGKKVGLRLFYNENWIAGAYYILNIIHAINKLKLEKKPIIVILTDNLKHFNFVKNETNYPFLEYFQYPFQIPKKNLFKRIINKVSRIFLRKNYFIDVVLQPDIDFLYPLQLENIDDPKLKKVNWVPDFQEAHLPEYFSKKEIKDRKKYQRKVICKGDFVVFSSKDAQNDFKRLYPKAKVISKILHFAVTLPDFSHVKIDSILEKYNLTKNYFFCPNQFWAHKNHIVVLKAVKALKAKRINVQVAFSGKEKDYRNLNNFGQLKEFLETNNLQNCIKFLGFIDRIDQLCLMKNAIAIVQPSLFEGWSTVVEDAKALNKFIILSNLDVHHEQINRNVEFFDPRNEFQLAELLDHYSKHSPKLESIDYSLNVKKFACDFLEIVDSAT